MRTFTFLAALLAILAPTLVLAGCGSSGGEQVTVTVSDTPENSDLADAPEQDSGVAPDDALEEPTAKITDRQIGGAPARDGNITFQVKSLKKVSSIPAADEYSDPIRPKSGADLWAATVTVRNDGKTGAGPMCTSDVVAIDTQERNFEYDGEAMIDNGSSGCGGELQPGFRATYVLPFHVPSGTQLVGVGTWDNDEESDMGGEESWIRWQR